MTRARDLASRSGLIQVVPTSVTINGGSASVNSNGTIIFNSVLSVTANDCFVSGYDNYKVVLITNSSSSSADLVSSMSTTSSVYFSTRTQTTSGGSGGISIVNGGTGMNLGRTAPSGGVTVLDVINPNRSGLKTFITCQSSDADGLASAGGGYVNSTAVESRIGFSYSSATFSGTLRVYGYNNG